LRTAFATCSAIPEGWEDDHPAAQLLGADYRCWDDPDVDWQRYDRVVIRSTWDYTRRVQEFVAWARRVGPERLRNHPELVAFNVDKRYLAALAVPSVPTAYVAPGEALPALAGEVVVKPNVSAGARDTGRFGTGAHDGARMLIERILASGRVALVQRYMPAVERDGEAALVFIGGAFSHALHKRAILQADEVAPTIDDELGVATAMRAPDLVDRGHASPEQRAFAERVLAAVARRFGTPLYARVDLLADDCGAPLLLELEAVEPTLYLAHADGGSERLAQCALAG